MISSARSAPTSCTSTSRANSGPPMPPPSGVVAGQALLDLAHDGGARLRAHAPQGGHLGRQRLDLALAEVLEDVGGALGAEADEQDGGLLAAAQAGGAAIDGHRRGRPRCARCARGRAWPARSFRILADPGAQLLGDALRLLLHEAVDASRARRRRPRRTPRRGSAQRSWCARARPAGAGPRSRSATSASAGPPVSRRRRARVMKKRKSMLARPIPTYFSGPRRAGGTGRPAGPGTALGLAKIDGALGHRVAALGVDPGGGGHGVLQLGRLGGRDRLVHQQRDVELVDGAGGDLRVRDGLVDAVVGGARRALVVGVAARRPPRSARRSAGWPPRRRCRRRRCRCPSGSRSP